jgi:hypothetical protein
VARFSKAFLSLRLVTARRCFADFHGLFWNYGPLAILLHASINGDSNSNFVPVEHQKSLSRLESGSAALHFRALARIIFRGLGQDEGSSGTGCQPVTRLSR